MEERSPPGHYLKSREMYSLLGLVEYRPDARYLFTPGVSQSRFLEGLREGKILGRRCPSCGRVYVPPRSYCEYCMKPTREWVEVSGVGVVHTAVVSYISTFRERMEEPEIVAVIRLDAPGYTEGGYEFPGLFHRLCNVKPDDVISGRIIGMRVKARWKPREERRGDVNDIECFEPVEGVE